MVMIGPNVAIGASSPGKGGGGGAVVAINMNAWSSASGSWRSTAGTWQSMP